MNFASTDQLREMGTAMTETTTAESVGQNSGNSLPLSRGGIDGAFHLPRDEKAHEGPHCAELQASPGVPFHSELLTVGAAPSPPHSTEKVSHLSGEESGFVR